MLCPSATASRVPLSMISPDSDPMISLLKQSTFHLLGCISLRKRARLQFSVGLILNSQEKADRPTFPLSWATTLATRGFCERHNCYWTFEVKLLPFNLISHHAPIDFQWGEGSAAWTMSCFAASPQAGSITGKENFFWTSIGGFHDFDCLS
jgi:hypothetical protein